jgi:excisionase family DNA binding protein
MQEVLTTKQLATYLKLNELTIYKLVRLGVIPVIKLGKVLRFKKDVIEKWLDLESGWDAQFETLLRKTLEFGKNAGITEERIKRTISETRGK